MYPLLMSAEEDVQRFVAGFSPAVMSGGDAAVALARVSKMVKVLSGVETMLVRRVADAGAWARDGHSTVAVWAAAHLGCSVPAARTRLETAEQLLRLEATRAAVLAGELSVDQTRLVADAATADHGSERKLLDSAQQDGFRGLKRLADEVRNNSEKDPKKRDMRQHQNRSLTKGRHWDGSARFDLILPPGKAARFLAVLEPHRQAVFEAARRANERPTAAQLLADAFMSMVESAAQGVSCAAGECDGGDASGEIGGAAASRRAKRRGPGHVRPPRARRSRTGRWCTPSCRPKPCGGGSFAPAIPVKSPDWGRFRCRQCRNCWAMRG